MLRLINKIRKIQAKRKDDITISSKIFELCKYSDSDAFDNLDKDSPSQFLERSISCKMTERIKQPLIRDIVDVFLPDRWESRLRQKSYRAGKDQSQNFLVSDKYSLLRCQEQVVKFINQIYLNREYTDKAVSKILLSDLS